MGAASGITQALAGKSISDKLAGAKSTLKEANDKFPSPKTTSKPSGSFASAPYKMARKARCPPRVKRRCWGVDWARITRKCKGVHGRREQVICTNLVQ